MMNVLAGLVPMIATPSISVPDGGMTGLMLGGGVLALGVYARFLKNRKK